MNPSISVVCKFPWSHVQACSWVSAKRAGDRRSKCRCSRGEARWVSSSKKLAAEVKAERKEIIHDSITLTSLTSAKPGRKFPLYKWPDFSCLQSIGLLKGHLVLWKSWQRGHIWIRRAQTHSAQLLPVYLFNCLQKERGISWPLPIPPNSNSKTVSDCLIGLR